MNRTSTMGIFAHGAFGAVSSAPCGPHAARAPSGDCVCLPGYEGDPCAAIPIDKPCDRPGRYRSPVDRLCGCPPGTHANPDPTKDDCVPMSWYPSCRDAAGNSVPGCFMGQPASAVVPAFVVGALAGLTLSLALRALF